MSSEKDITKEQILDLEKQLLNRQFEDLEISIEKLNDKNFNQPSVKIIISHLALLIISRKYLGGLLMFGLKLLKKLRLN